MTRMRSVAVALVMTMIAAVPMSTVASAAPKKANPALAVPITGAVAGGGAVTGTFTIREFVRNNQGGIDAVGTLVASVPVGAASRTTVSEIRLPVDLDRSGSPTDVAAAAPDEFAVQATCDILNLVLGPLDLNLLGLEIHLNEVVLDIVAVTGAGNLLGNLLCALVGILDGPTLTGLLGQITNLLNQILGLLG
jgi:hypothetical protein